MGEKIKHTMSPMRFRNLDTLLHYWLVLLHYREVCLLHYQRGYLLHYRLIFITLSVVYYIIGCNR